MCAHLAATCTACDHDLRGSVQRARAVCAQCTPIVHLTQFWVWVTVLVHCSWTLCANTVHGHCSFKKNKMTPGFCGATVNGTSGNGVSHIWSLLAHMRINLDVVWLKDVFYMCIDLLRTPHGLTKKKHIKDSNKGNI